MANENNTKILLHIGQGKTGTTAIQRSFHSASKTLEGFGVYYPQIDHWGSGHFFLSVLFGKDINRTPPTVLNRFKNFDEACDNAEATWESLKQSCSQMNPNVLILSAETLAVEIPENTAGEPVRLLREISDDIQPIIFVRNPASRFLSSYQQGVKTQGKRQRANILKVRKVIESYEREFGRQVEIVPFEREQLSGGDVVTDFRERFLKEYIPEDLFLETNFSNDTVSAACMGLLLEYKDSLNNNGSMKLSPDFTRYRSIITDFEIKNGLHKRPEMNEELSSQIIRASTELLWLRDDRGIVFKDIDYNSIDGVRGSYFNKNYLDLEDVCQVDLKLHREIGAEVLKKLIQHLIQVQRLRSFWFEDDLEKN